MAAEREPPPLGDGKPTDFEELEDGEDLFTSTVSTLESSPSSPEPASLPTEDISANSNGPKPSEVVLDDDREDLFAALWRQGLCVVRAGWPYPELTV